MRAVLVIACVLVAAGLILLATGEDRPRDAAPRAGTSGSGAERIVRGEVRDDVPRRAVLPEPDEGRGHAVLEIVDARSGEPVPGARIVRSAGRHPEEQADQAGRWALLHAAPGWHDVTVGAPRHQGRAVRVLVRAGESTRHRVALVPGRICNGVVVDLDGNAIPGVIVTYAWRDGFLASATTGPNGRYAMAPPEEGRRGSVTIAAVDPKHRFATSGLYQKHPYAGPHRIRLVPAPRLIGRIVPPPRGEIRIRVVWRDALPDGNRRVDVKVPTDHDGRFVTTVVPPKRAIVLTIDVPGAAPILRRRDFLISGRDNDLGELPAAPGRPAELRVQAKGGRDLARASAALLLPGALPFPRVNADDRGVIRLGNVPLGAAIRVRVSAEGFVTREVPVTGLYGVARETVVLEAAGTLAGTAVDTHGAPLRGSVATRYDRKDPFFAIQRSHGLSVKIKRDGFFRTFLPPGVYDVGVRLRRGEKPRGAQRVWIDSGEETRVHFRVDPTSR